MFVRNVAMGPEKSDPRWVCPVDKAPTRWILQQKTLHLATVGAHAKRGLMDGGRRKEGGHRWAGSAPGGLCCCCSKGTSRVGGRCWRKNVGTAMSRGDRFLYGF